MPDMKKLDEWVCRTTGPVRRISKRKNRREQTAVRVGFFRFDKQLGGLTKLTA
jgi:choline kinase